MYHSIIPCKTTATTEFPSLGGITSAEVSLWNLTYRDGFQRLVNKNVGKITKIPRFCLFTSGEWSAGGME